MSKVHFATSGIAESALLDSEIPEAVVSSLEWQDSSAFELTFPSTRPLRTIEATEGFFFFLHSFSEVCFPTETDTSECPSTAPLATRVRAAGVAERERGGSERERSYCERLARMSRERASARLFFADPLPAPKSHLPIVGEATAKRAFQGKD